MRLSSIVMQRLSKKAENDARDGGRAAGAAVDDTGSREADGSGPGDRGAL